FLARVETVYPQTVSIHQTITRTQIFKLKKKRSTLAVAPFQFLGRKLKRPVRVSIRLLISELMKKQSILLLRFSHF
ncbi:TPA: hypothetical protein ACGO2V_000427, partial [Streptococcus suis]